VHPEHSVEIYFGEPIPTHLFDPHIFICNIMTHLLYGGCHKTLKHIPKKLIIEKRERIRDIAIGQRNRDDPMPFAIRFNPGGFNIERYFFPPHSLFYPLHRNVHIFGDFAHGGVVHDFNVIRNSTSVCHMVLPHIVHGFVTEIHFFTLTAIVILLLGKQFRYIPRRTQPPSNFLIWNHVPEEFVERCACQSSRDTRRDESIKRCFP